MTITDASVIVPSDTKQVLSNTTISNWAFTTLVGQHMQEAVANGTFYELQEMLKKHGFVVGVYNAKKKRVRDSTQKKGNNR